MDLVIAVTRKSLVGSKRVISILFRVFESLNCLSSLLRIMARIFNYCSSIPYVSTVPGTPCRYTVPVHKVTGGRRTITSSWKRTAGKTHLDIVFRSIRQSITLIYAYEYFREIETRDERNATTTMKHALFAIYVTLMISYGVF
jgi:hypothetical protein